MTLYVYIYLLYLVLLNTNAIEESEVDVSVDLSMSSSRSEEMIISCPKNEIYKTCVRNCSDCTQRGMCARGNCTEGCDCIPLFFRLTPDGPCEPAETCPIPECGENETFRNCGPACERCDSFRGHVINCDHKCYCKEGYLRDDEGKCIPEADCPKDIPCSTTEEWAEDGPVDEYCLHGSNYTKNNETRGFPHCFCKKGYKRNIFGYCIEEKHCTFIACIGIEVYYDCIPQCNTTCRNYGNPNCTEDDNCYTGCFCPPGYVMNDFRGCTLIEECSLDMIYDIIGDYDEIYEFEPDVAETNTSEIKENTTSSENSSCIHKDTDDDIKEMMQKLKTLDENTTSTTEEALTSTLTPIPILNAQASKDQGITNDSENATLKQNTTVNSNDEKTTEEC